MVPAFRSPGGLLSRGPLSRSRWTWRLRVASLAVLLVLLITPLRNALMPRFLWNDAWNDLHSLKLLRIHVFDLFYSIDRTPYTGSCELVHKQLGTLQEIRATELPVYTLEDWQAAIDRVRGKVDPEDFRKLDYFRPALTPDEQREMLYGLLVLARALEAFNVTYFVAEGSLLGLHRHHGLIPWDDDVDLMLKADQWQTAKQVLSCIPDFSLSMGRDFMWKFMWNRSKFWKNENFIRFPYIDVFPYNEDSEHLWPLTIWMKRDLIWRWADTYPAQRLPLEGHMIAAPRDPAAVLVSHYGPDTLTVCASRIFMRREREPFPHEQRVRIPCRLLHEVYPFVFHQTHPVDGRPVQRRQVGQRVLSTFLPGP